MWLLQQMVGTAGSPSPRVPKFRLSRLSTQVPRIIDVLISDGFCKTEKPVGLSKRTLPRSRASTKTVWRLFEVVGPGSCSWSYCCRCFTKDVLEGHTQDSKLLTRVGTLDTSLFKMYSPWQHIPYGQCQEIKQRTAKKNQARRSQSSKVCIQTMLAEWDSQITPHTKGQSVPVVADRGLVRWVQRLWQLAPFFRFASPEDMLRWAGLPGQTRFDWQGARIGWMGSGNFPYVQFIEIILDHYGSWQVMVNQVMRNQHISV